MYNLVTERLYLTLSSPFLAKEVSCFNIKNQEALKDTEPHRPKEYYTAWGMAKILLSEKREADSGESFRFWLREKGSKEIIGTVCISSVMFGSVKSCYLSYKIAARKQGQGYATEAVKEIINFAFNILKLHRIESYVMPRNTKSLRVMEKLNFEQEGVSKRCLEVNGVWEDHIRFSLLNE